MPDLDAMGLWRERLRLSATATTGDIFSDPVKSGERWYLGRVAVRDQTGANADCLVAIERLGELHELHYFRNLEANEWAAEDIGVWLSEDQRVKLEWTGVVSGDVLEGRITGHKRYRSRGGA